MIPQNGLLSPPPDDLSLLDVAAALPITTHRDADFYCEDIIFLVCLRPMVRIVPTLSNTSA